MQCDENLSDSDDVEMQESASRSSQDDNESDDLQPDAPPAPKFRLQSQTLFLTYSQCPLPKEHVLETLQSLLRIRDYIVAEERHADGNSHIHCYLKLLEKSNTRDPTFLDLEGLEGEIFHPNIQSVRSPTQVQKYCTKEGNYLTNLQFYAGW